MCLKIFTSTFILLAIVLTIQLITLCAGITDKMKPMRSSDYLSVVASVMIAYVINAFVLVLFIPDVYSKILMATFGLVPFIIGQVVNYRRLKFYSYIQILCVISSGLYIIGF